MQISSDSADWLSEETFKQEVLPGILTHNFGFLISALTKTAQSDLTSKVEGAV